MTETLANTEVHENLEDDKVMNMHREVNKAPVDMREDGLDTVTYKVLEVVQKVMGPDVNATVDDDFFALGGDSFKCLMAIRELHREKLYIDVNDFLQATTIKEVADKVFDTKYISEISPVRTSEFQVEFIDGKSDNDLIKHFIAHSFAEMQPLDLLVGTEESSLLNLVHSIWSEVVADNLSIIVQHRKTSAILAAAIVLNCASFVIPDITGRRAVIDIVNATKKPVLCDLDNKSRWAEYFLAAVSCDASYDDRIRLLQLTQSHVLSTCQQRGYSGVITVSTNPVTAMLNEMQFGYTVENEIHVRSFEFEGKRPFENADDDFKVKTMIKRLR